ncbi:MAG: PIN domain-containing protein [Anaerolineae bacterium]|nr:PIN domain-containing protein [Anaerolineae bacterium]
MLKFFLDTSILISMVMSHAGGSYELFKYAENNPKQVTLYINDYVRAEAHEVFSRNKQTKFLLELDKILAHPLWQEIDTTSDEDEVASLYLLDPDDAPIIAAAKNAKVDALISFDRKHLHTKKVEAYIGAPVITSGEALQRLRAQL